MLEIKSMISKMKMFLTGSLVEWTQMRKVSRNLKIGKKELSSLKHKEGGNERKSKPTKPKN